MTVKRKVQAGMCFILRLPLVVFIVLHVVYLSEAVTSQNKGVSFTRPIIFRQVELCYALLSAAVPALNQWLRQFDTSQRTAFGFDPTQYHTSSRAYQLSSMKRSRLRSHVEPEGSTGPPKFTPTTNKYQASCEWQNTNKDDGNDSQDGVQSDRNNSEDMIIRKEMQYDIYYEEPAKPRPT